MSDYEYAVVLFEMEDSVAIVHTSWVDSERNELFCYWPSDKHALRAKRKEIPDKDRWPKYKVRILSYTVEYEQALRHAKRAEDTEHVATEEEEERIKRTPNRYIQQAYDADDENVDEPPAKKASTSTPRTITLPQLPVLRANDHEQPSTSMTNEQQTLKERQSSLEASIFSPFQRTASPALTADTDNDETNTEFQCNVLMKLDIIIQNQETQLALLNSVGTDREDPVLALDDLLPDPVQTIQQMDQLDTKLEQSQNLRKTMVVGLTSMGGQSVTDTARRMLYKIGTPGLWCHYNMKGRGNKEALISLKMYRLINRACRKIHPNMKEYELEAALSSVLKHAPNKRGGYRFHNRATSTPTATATPLTVSISDDDDM